MPKTQHTPGPWRGDMPHNGRAAVMTEDCLQVIADCGRQDEAEANAKLIAAAPDLLQACRRLLSVCDAETEACGIYSEHQRIAREAIAKATR